jgi:interleukin-1 receptor-associated kinase 1
MTMTMGTTGYMDPVSLKTQMLSTQADIYSFGVIILQLLTGWESVIGITDEVKIQIRDRVPQENIRCECWKLALCGS